MNTYVKWLITILILIVIVNRAENFKLKIILNIFYWVWRSNKFKSLAIAAVETLLATRNKMLSNKIWNCFFPNYKKIRIMLWIVRQNILPLDLILWILTLLISVIFLINLIKTSPSKFSKMKRKQNKQEKKEILKIPIPNSCGSTSQTHRRLLSSKKQTNRLKIKIPFRIICRFSIVTSFSNLYFTLVIITTFSEEEKVGRDPRQISRDYSLLNEYCIYNTETTFFQARKTDEIQNS